MRGRAYAFVQYRAKRERERDRDKERERERGRKGENVVSRNTFSSLTNRISTPTILELSNSRVLGSIVGGGHCRIHPRILVIMSGQTRAIRRFFAFPSTRVFEIRAGDSRVSPGSNIRTRVLISRISPRLPKLARTLPSRSLRSRS